MAHMKRKQTAPSVSGLHLWDARVDTASDLSLWITTTRNNIRDAAIKAQRVARAANPKATVGRVVYMGTLDG